MSEEGSETRVDSVAALEGVIGKTPPPLQLKVIDHLDASALRWIAASPLMFAGLSSAGGVGVTLAGGTAGFAQGGARELRLPLAALDDPQLTLEGAGFGSLFLAPGVGETLRVNGRVAQVQGGEVLIAVEECYVHCAKALIRSDFWAAAPIEETFQDPAAFVAASRFMALATTDADGRSDLSPKGDPARTMARLDGDRLWFADRPGNRRADSFRNILAQPQMAAVLLTPGSRQVVVVRGVASLTTEETARAPFVVQGKTPLLAACVEELALNLRPSLALERAALWPLMAPAEGLDPAKMLVAHVKLNRDKGAGARLAGAMLSIPGLMQKGLEKDYKTNLY